MSKQVTASCFRRHLRRSFDQPASEMQNHFYICAPLVYSAPRAHTLAIFCLLLSRRWLANTRRLEPLGETQSDADSKITGVYVCVTTKGGSQFVRVALRPQSRNTNSLWLKEKKQPPGVHSLHHGPRTHTGKHARLRLSRRCTTWCAANKLLPGCGNATHCSDWRSVSNIFLLRGTFI